MSEAATNSISPGAKSALVRTGIILVCICCIWIVYWSLFSRLQPANREHQKKVLELSHLADEIENLKFKAKLAAIEETKAKYKETEGLVFATEKQLRGWQTHLRRQASSRAMTANVRLDPPTLYTDLEQKLALVRANVELSPSMTMLGTNSTYQRILTFSDEILKGEKRFDLLEFTLKGNSNSVHYGRAVFHLYTAPKPTK